MPQENMVFDPEASLNEVVRWTHYLPVEWRGQLHSQMVGVLAAFFPYLSLNVRMLTGAYRCTKNSANCSH